MPAARGREDVLLRGRVAWLRQPAGLSEPRKMSDGSINARGGNEAQGGDFPIGHSGGLLVKNQRGILTDMREPRRPAEGGFVFYLIAV